MAEAEMEYPNFDVSCLLPHNDLFDDVDLDMFKDNFLEEMDFMPENQQTMPENQQTMPENQQTMTEPSTKHQRFKSLTTTELADLSEQRFSKSTKRNSKWGFKVFTEWCTEKNIEIDLADVSPEELSSCLAVFYAEAQPKPAKGKENAATEYHKNTLKNMRAALNRVIQVDCGRNLNIVTDSCFKKANDMLNGKLKNDCRQGLSRPTSHKSVIPSSEMQKMFKYLNVENPVSLRYKVWVQLSLQYVSRGIEFHGQLTPKSFRFVIDETGAEYATLVHTTQQKNHQGDMNSTEEFSDKRMYATGDANCPIQALKSLISKLSPTATNLFCHINKDAIASPQDHMIWYGPKSVGKRQFSNFMADICRNAALEKKYTAHCLRATSLSVMTDNDIPARHIMSLSDHSSEKSLIPYTRPSTEHKQRMSRILSDVCTENPHRTQTPPASTLSRHGTSSSSPNTQMNAGSSSSSPKTQMNTMLNGFITNSSCTFTNCNFSFDPK